MTHGLTQLVLTSTLGSGKELSSFCFPLYVLVPILQMEQTEMQIKAFFYRVFHARLMGSSPGVLTPTRFPSSRYGCYPASQRRCPPHPRSQSYLPYPLSSLDFDQEDPPTVALNPVVGHTGHRCLLFYVVTKPCGVFIRPPL